jgi:8-oxo-dGTP pyrophosphatase MutT (NUDIX family)
MKKEQAESLLPAKAVSAREEIEGHFTVSALVIALGHVLLVDHKKIGAWLPPGGHINPAEMPHEAATREVLEETGIEIAILSEPISATVDSESIFMPQPIAIHRVKACENNEYVYHFDLAYLGVPTVSTKFLPDVRHSQEVNGARWFRLEEMGDFSEVILAKNVIELITLAKRKMKLLND